MASNRTPYWDNGDGNFPTTSRDTKNVPHYYEEVFPCACMVQCTEAANKRLMESSQEGSSNQDQQVMSLMNLHPIGLELQVTPSLLVSVQNEVDRHNHSTVGEARSKLEHQLNDPPTKVDEKCKAANFHASFIRIGSWQRTSLISNDLVAKCYYAKKKLVWEVMENRLKKKIELPWSAIIAIKATTPENKPGTLEIELNNPPHFFEEHDPEPRKHTTWKMASDFTDGEASRCRRHLLKFPPGVLDRHYQSLLRYEPRLFELSHRDFPSLSSPYFDTYSTSGPTDFSLFGFNGSEGCLPPPVEFRFAPGVPPPVMATYPAFQETRSPMSVLDLADEHFNSNRNVYVNPGMGSLVQGSSSSYPQLLPSGHVRRLMPSTFPPNQLISSASAQYYNNPSASSQVAQEGFNFDQSLLRATETQLPNDMVPCDDNYPPARIDSWYPMVNLANQQNQASQIDLPQVYYDHDRSIVGNGLVLNGNDNLRVLGTQYYQQPPTPPLPQTVSGWSPLVSPWNPVMHHAGNNLGGDPGTANFMTDSRMEHSSSDNSSKGLGAHHHRTWNGGWKY